MDSQGVDFFISYTEPDRSWAEWIAWVLEAANYRVRIQAWDFRAGGNFVLEMDRASAEAPRTIAVLSPDYLNSRFGKPEWAAAFAGDPEGWKRALVPVRVCECAPEGLLRGIIYIDLVDKQEDEAEQALLKGVSERRNKPAARPSFPGVQGTARVARRPSFPGAEPSRFAPRPSSGTAPFMPEIRGAPSDLDKRRFMQSAFGAIVSRFKQALDELRSRHAEVEYEFNPVTQTKYIAEIFVHGKSRARCKFWLADKMLGGGIAYSETDIGWADDNSYNEMLTMAPGELALRATMGTFGGRETEGLDLEHLTGAAAAEYYWRRFAYRLT